MAVVLTLPALFPLQPVTATLLDSVKVKDNTARKWLLSMVSILQSQNSSTREAVAVWKKGMDKHFEGVEECPICYSIIDTATRSLPRMACPGCKNKFHSACLYKWFNSSGDNKCPMCRGRFS